MPRKPALVFTDCITDNLCYDWSAGEMNDFYLRIIKFEERLDVADELRVSADQRLYDGHARPGLLARPLRVRGGGPPVQPPLPETG